MTGTITVRLFGVDREFTRDSDPASSIYWHQLSDDDNEFIDLLEEGPGWWSAHICIGEKDANFADYFAHGDSAQDAASKLEAKMMPLAKLLAPMVVNGSCFGCWFRDELLERGVKLGRSALTETLPSDDIGYPLGSWIGEVERHLNRDYEQRDTDASELAEIEEMGG
jgi:hypothetical protein